MVSVRRSDDGKFIANTIRTKENKFIISIVVLSNRVPPPLSTPEAQPSKGSKLCSIPTNPPNPFSVVPSHVNVFSIIYIPNEVYYDHVYQDRVRLVLHVEFEEKKLPVKEKNQQTIFAQYHNNVIIYYATISYTQYSSYPLLITLALSLSRLHQGCIQVCQQPCCCLVTVTQQHKQHPFFSRESNSRMTKVCLCQNHLTIILNHQYGHQPLCSDCKKDSKVTDNHLFATSKSYWLIVF